MMTLPSKSSTALVAIGVGALLLVALIAQWILEDMNWGAEDFLAAAILLFCGGMAFSALVPITKTKWQRWLISTAIFLVFAAIWAELAVGLFP